MKSEFYQKIKCYKRFLFPWNPVDQSMQKSISFLKLFSTLKIFLEQQIIILEWFLKDHVNAALVSIRDFLKNINHSCCILVSHYHLESRVFFSVSSLMTCDFQRVWNLYDMSVHQQWPQIILRSIPMLASCGNLTASASSVMMIASICEFSNTDALLCMIQQTRSKTCQCDPRPVS